MSKCLPCDGTGSSWTVEYHPIQIVCMYCNGSGEARTPHEDDVMRIEQLEHERDEALAAFNKYESFSRQETKELIRLRKAIEDAPHAIQCRAFEPGYYGDCDCWKREALKVESDE